MAESDRVLRVSSQEKGGPGIAHPPGDNALAWALRPDLRREEPKSAAPFTSDYRAMTPRPRNRVLSEENVRPAPERALSSLIQPFTAHMPLNMVPNPFGRWSPVNPQPPPRSAPPRPLETNPSTGKSASQPGRNEKKPLRSHRPRSTPTRIQPTRTRVVKEAVQPQLVQVTDPSGLMITGLIRGRRLRAVQLDGVRIIEGGTFEISKGHPHVMEPGQVGTYQVFRIDGGSVRIRHLLTQREWTIQR